MYLAPSLIRIGERNKKNLVTYRYENFKLNAILLLYLDFQTNLDSCQMGQQFVVDFFCYTNEKDCTYKLEEAVGFSISDVLSKTLDYRWNGLTN